MVYSLAIIVYLVIGASYFIDYAVIANAEGRTPSIATLLKRGLLWPFYLGA
jgi:hypothetical protein